jgi:hypothetical protein
MGRIQRLLAAGVFPARATAVSHATNGYEALFCKDPRDEDKPPLRGDA